MDLGLKGKTALVIHPQRKDDNTQIEEGKAMVISLAHLHAIVAIGFGVLILIIPRLLSYLVAIYLIPTGLIGLGLQLPR